MRAAPRRLLVGLAPALALTVVLGAGCAAFGGVGRRTPGGPEAEAGGAQPAATPAGPPVGLDVARRLRYPPLRFDPPEPERFTLSNGVTVFFLRDRTLPVLDLFIDLKGGYVFFDREFFGAASALPSLVRNAGTASLPPDSLDELIEFNALGVSISSDGGRMILGVTGLSRQLDLLTTLWGEILLAPRFDAAAVERWRLRELESVRRVGDFPGSLAVLEFNHLMYGDHPTGWMMTEADLTPERLAQDRLRMLHRRLVCPQGAVIGAAGDVDRDTLRAALERTLAGWHPCERELEAPPPPTLRKDRSIYVIPKSLSQSTIVVGQPGGVLLRESSDYFASRVANWIIGGSGFTSRLVNRLRTQEGLAYSAASIWGAAREHPRIFGAITHTKSESTISAARVVLETMRGAVDDPPGRREVELARDAIVNGFVFGFGSPIQVVSRQVAYLADGFPEDWLTRYVEGVKDVDSVDVARVLRRHVDPRGFTILIVGDTTLFDPAWLGPVTYLPAR
ncbi:MAG TPA: pitrilysin family protein [Longimicrobiales bacterium]|nr:pitrilysin family protein [Longimicrobiales bacterium]